MRDRAAALSAALRRQQRFDSLRRAGRVTITIDGATGAELDHGRLVRAWQVTSRGIAAVPLPLDLDPAAPDRLVPGSEPGTPLPSALADELACVAGWIDRESARIEVVRSDGPLFVDGPPLPTFEPAKTLSLR